MKHARRQKQTTLIVCVESMCRMNREQQQITGEEKPFSSTSTWSEFIRSNIQQLQLLVSSLWKNHIIKIGCRAKTWVEREREIVFNCSVYRMRDFLVVVFFVFRPHYVHTNRACMLMHWLHTSDKHAFKSRNHMFVQHTATHTQACICIHSVCNTQPCLYRTKLAFYKRLPFVVSYNVI